MVIVMSIPVVVLCLCMIIVAKIAFKLTHVKADENRRNIQEIVASRGFRLESYSVTTNDDYVLVLHRIVNPFLVVKPRQPILLMHGLGSHSLFWLLNDDVQEGWRSIIEEAAADTMNQDSNNNNNNNNKKINNSLGYSLSALGFDVWLGNQRGNRFCQKHLNLSNQDNKFWDFSLDEISLFDLPAIIDFILSTTNASSIGYIGHSQGSSAILALLATQVKYNSLVKPCIVMSPVVKTTHSSYVAKFAFLLKNYFTKTIPYSRPLYPSSFTEFVLQLLFCNHCLESFSSIIGRCLFSAKHINYLRVSSFLAYPALHASRKNALQYLQFIRGPFARFDYGSAKNMQVYRSKKPPIYDLSCITNDSLCIIYSQDDSCVSATDVKLGLIDSLKCVHYVFLIKKKKWDHQDFLLAKNCASVINVKVVNILMKFLDQDNNSSFLVDKKTILLSIREQESSNTTTTTTASSASKSTSSDSDMMLTHRDDDDDHRYHSSTSSSSFEMMMIPNQEEVSSSSSVCLRQRISNKQTKNT